MTTVTDRRPRIGSWWVMENGQLALVATAYTSDNQVTVLLGYYREPKAVHPQRCRWQLNGYIKADCSADPKNLLRQLPECSSWDYKIPDTPSPPMLKTWGRSTGRDSDGNPIYEVVYAVNPPLGAVAIKNAMAPPGSLQHEFNCDWNIREGYST